MEMNDKNINKTFDINDLCSSIDHQVSKRQISFSDEIHHELEISEINQKHRLSAKLEKRLHYQKEIETLQKKLKYDFNNNLNNDKLEDDFKTEKNKKNSNMRKREIENNQNKVEDDFKKEKIGNFNDTISNMKNELKNSQNLSKSINQLLQSEYALKSRLHEENEKKMLNENLTNEEIKKEEIKKSEKNWNKENFDENNFEIMRPIYQDPFKKVFKKKEEEKQNKEKLNKKEERQKLYERYVKLLKMKKDIIESKGKISNP